MKKDFLLLAIILCFFFFVVFYLGRPFESFECKNNRHKLNEMFRGKISKKIKDSYNHQKNEVILLENEEIFVWQDNNYAPYQIFDMFEVGDSIVKEKGSLEILVKRDTYRFATSM